MNKHVFIINGSGGVGKDTFVKLVGIKMNDIHKGFGTVWNYSSVKKVKDIAKQVGWDGGKTEKDRKFLSDLKVLISEYSDAPFNDMKDVYNEFLDDDKSYFLFFHIREPKEIERAAREFSARTVLVIRDDVKHIESNMADKNVFNYEYDYIICNNSSMDYLEKLAAKFIQIETWGDEN